MYSLDCSYYDREFETVDELINDVMSSGMDPSYEITRDGEYTGSTVMDLISL